MPTPRGACVDSNSCFILVSSRDQAASRRVYAVSHEFKQVEHSGLEWGNSHPQVTLNGPVTLSLCPWILMSFILTPRCYVDNQDADGRGCC